MTELNISRQAHLAHVAGLKLARMSDDDKKQLLLAFSQALLDEQQSILIANEQDINNAYQAKISDALIDRLRLSAERIFEMSEAMKALANIKSPVGDVMEERRIADDLLLKKVRVPIGVIGVIYESRPNVTADVVALCIKSGNAVILKGGKEAIHSNRAIVKILKSCFDNIDVSKMAFVSDAIQFIDATDREATYELLQQKDDIDLIIPRGGKGLIQAVIEHSQIPVLKHLHGICHLYIDKNADENMAESLCINSKCHRPGVCNAIETLLIHEKVAFDILPRLAEALKNNSVKLIGCEKSRAILKDDSVQLATEEDWETEYLDLILSIRIVASLEDAILHINYYGSKHSDVICTKDEQRAQVFMQAVDSACVYHNASSRYTDGAQFGKGAEMGISTDKLHARGPVGLEELTIYKYLIYGDGQTRN